MKDVIKFGLDMCTALGIDPLATHTDELTLHMKAGELPVVTVHRFVIDEDPAAITEAVDRYELHPVLVEE
jgi:hypothetical protein